MTSNLQNATVCSIRPWLQGEATKTLLNLADITKVLRGFSNEFECVRCLLFVCFTLTKSAYTAQTSCYKLDKIRPRHTTTEKLGKSQCELKMS